MFNIEFFYFMDMFFGVDGNFYVLEYGQKWNVQNVDVCFSCIKYIKGNWIFIVRMLVDKEVGVVFLMVVFKGEDFEDFD